MDRAFPTMIRKDNSPKHKLQKTFQLLMSIERKRRLSTVKGIKICRLNFRRFHRVLGPFLGISGNYRSPITYPSVTKQNGLLFCFFFVSFVLFCFVFFFFIQDHAFIVQILFLIFGSGLKSCGTLSLGNGPLVSANVLACTARESGEKGTKNATNAFFVFQRKQNKLDEQQGLQGSRIFYESLARYMFVKSKRFKNQVNISATFMKPFIKANCAIFKQHNKKVRKRLF